MSLGALSLERSRDEERVLFVQVCNVFYSDSV